MAVHVVKVELLGASFSVQTDETKEYLESLLAELSRRFSELRSATRVDDPLRLSILGCITLLDELTRLRGSIGEPEDLSRRAEDLIGRLDAGLGGFDREPGKRPGAWAGEDPGARRGLPPPAEVDFSAGRR